MRGIMIPVWLLGQASAAVVAILMFAATPVLSMDKPASEPSLAGDKVPPSSATITRAADHGRLRSQDSGERRGGGARRLHFRGVRE